MVSGEIATLSTNLTLLESIEKCQRAVLILSTHLKKAAAFTLRDSRLIWRLSEALLCANQSKCMKKKPTCKIVLLGKESTGRSFVTMRSETYLMRHVKRVSSK